MGLSQDLQKAQLWPIKAKGKVNRLSFAGVQKIENVFHPAMEQGRVLESSVTDAMFQLKLRKQQLIEHIENYMQMISVASDAKLKRRPRGFKLAADISNILNKVNNFQSEISGLARAITNNIGQLQTIEQNMLRMVQANSNALANLLHEVCNWGLPDLPAIPNLFSDTLWYWNGFNFFPLAAFQPHVGFDFNFAFNQCVIHIPNVNIFRNYPSTVQTYSGLSYGTPFFVPPLGGIIPNTGINIHDPNLIDYPVYAPNGYTLMGDQTVFNPNSSMLGSVPDPSSILNNYQMPAQTYQDNIVSIMPDTRGVVVEPGDPDYNNPDLTTRQASLRKLLVHFVSLENIVATNFDPYITSAWVYYLNAARQGRGGFWLPNFEAVYQQVIQPSVDALTKNNVPWNAFEGTISNKPSVPLIDLFNNLDPGLLLNLYWKLSYIEASLLGYTRAKDWEASADPFYLSTFTESDLDYMFTPVSTTVNSLTLGLGKATFPVPATYPTSFDPIMTQVITQATADINAATSYISPLPQNRFIYDQFAQAKQVDRFSQFWRDFGDNLTVFLVQDPYLVQQVSSYFEALNGVLNPLADKAAYNQIRADAAARNRTWTPGTPLLNIPKAPIVSYQSNDVGSDNGWRGLDLDANAFLARPDIQAQPIPVQLAMLRTNLSYAGIQKWSQGMQDAINEQITAAQAVLTALGQLGFHATSLATTTLVPVASAGTPVAFDNVDPTKNPADWDYTSNFTNPTTFTLQADGQYMMSGQIDWDTGSVGIRAILVTKNGVPFFTQETDSVAGPVEIQFADSESFAKGDVIQVLAYHTCPDAQNVLPGSFFSMIQTSATADTIPPATEGSNTASFIAGSTFSAMTAVRVGSDGRVVPIDVTTVATDVPTGAVIPPYPDGISVTDATVNLTVDVATGYGKAFGSSIPLTTGGLLYVKPDGSLTDGSLSQFENLINGVYGSVSWIICVGRAQDASTFIYEPHLPSRTI